MKQQFFPSIFHFFQIRFDHFCCFGSNFLTFMVRCTRMKKKDETSRFSKSWLESLDHFYCNLCAPNNFHVPIRNKKTEELLPEKDWYANNFSFRKEVSFFVFEASFDRSGCNLKMFSVRRNTKPFFIFCTFILLHFFFLEISSIS